MQVRDAIGALADGQTVEPHLPLSILTNRRMWEWESYRRQSQEEGSREWVAFVWRIAVPLSNRVNFLPAWAGAT